MSVKLLEPAEVAEQLGIPKQTLYAWRVEGRGPRGVKVGRHLRYRQADIDLWVEANADPAPAA